jgi:hypothetical protein
MADYGTTPSAAALALAGQGTTAMLCYILDALLGVIGGNVAPTPPTPAPATIAAGVTYSTGIIPAAGYNMFAASAQLNQTGTLTLQRYIDEAGTIAIGAAITQAMTADVLATVAVNDGLPCASFKVTVENTSGSLGTLSNFHILAKV